MPHASGLVQAKGSGWVEGSQNSKWTTLFKQDLDRARKNINDRHAELEIRHAEVIAALQQEHARACGELATKLAEIDDLERGLDAFASEFLTEDQQDPGEQASVR